MNLVTVSGSPSVGKTSVILKTIVSLKNRGLKVGVVKFDCLFTDDDILYVNGLTGQGSFELSTLLYEKDENITTLKGKTLRFSMPAALCSYCLGETRIGESYQMGNVRKIDLGKKEILQYLVSLQ